MRALSRKGFTMLELVISASLGIMLVASAAVVMISVAQSKKIATRNVDTAITLVAGPSQVEFDFDSAGYRFPSSAFGVRILNNYSEINPGAFPLWDAANSVATNNNVMCGSLPGYTDLAPVDGSDVIDLSYGWTGLSPGVVNTVKYPTKPPAGFQALYFGSTMALNATHSASYPSATNDITDTNYGANAPAQFQLQLGILSPFTTDDLAINGSTGVFDDSSGYPIIMAKDQTTSCAMAVKKIDKDGNVWGYYLDTSFKRMTAGGRVSSHCPAPGMNVYRLEKRVRYMLCYSQSEVSGGSRNNSVHGFLIRREINGLLNAGTTLPTPLFQNIGSDSGNGAMFTDRTRTKTSEVLSTKVQDNIADLQFSPVLNLGMMNASDLTQMISGGNLTAGCAQPTLPLNHCAAFSHPAPDTFKCQLTSHSLQPVPDHSTDILDLWGGLPVTAAFINSDARWWVRGMVIGIVTISPNKGDEKQPDVFDHVTTGSGFAGWTYKKATRAVRVDNLSIVQ